MLQGGDHFIHGLETLREEFLCAASARLMNISLKWRLATQRGYFTIEDEIRERDGGENGEKEYRLRSFIAASMIDVDQYWHGVREKCFALSSQMGAPTFFLTLTMNPYWLEYQIFKRGNAQVSDATLISIVFWARLKCLIKYCRRSHLLGNVTAFVWQIEYNQRIMSHAHVIFWTDCDTLDVQAIERIVNTRYPESSPLEKERQMVSHYRILIKQFQIDRDTP
jgi:hypothetical protein